MMGWYGGMGGGFGGGWLGIGLVVLLLMAAVVTFVRTTGRGPQGFLQSQRPDARQLLDETFARGGLTQEEYLRRRQLLQGR